MWRFLASQWETLTADQQASWINAPCPFAGCLYSAYLGVNLANWARLAPPGKTWPVQRILTPAVFELKLLDDGVHMITLRPRVFSDPNRWGFVIWRSKSPGVELTAATLAIAWPSPGAGTLAIEDRGLLAGVYYYRIATFTRDGNLNIYNKERSAQAFDP